MYWNSYPPYVSVAKRKAQAAKRLKKLEKEGSKTSPVKIEGKKIATSFWGCAWCDNLESYSDFSNRLPRGRTYVRNGSVIDLQIKKGLITSLVSGSNIYKIKIDINPLAKPKWNDVKSRCAGQIGSLVDLLQGKLSQDVMTVVTERERGLFPKPSEIKMSCSCPDYASLCKHLAAVLYAIGARLDQRPELLFLLRGLDHLELITAASEQAVSSKKMSGKKTLAADSLADVFGIEIEPTDTPPAADAVHGSKHTEVKAAKKRERAASPALAPAKSAKKKSTVKSAKPQSTDNVSPAAVKLPAAKPPRRTKSVTTKPQKPK